MGLLHYPKELPLTVTDSEYDGRDAKEVILRRDQHVVGGVGLHRELHHTLLERAHAELV